MSRAHLREELLPEGGSQFGLALQASRSPSAPDPRGAMTRSITVCGLSASGLVRTAGLHPGLAVTSEDVARPTTSRLAPVHRQLGAGLLRSRTLQVRPFIGVALGLAIRGAGTALR